MAIVAGAVNIQIEEADKYCLLHFSGKLDALSSPSAEKKILDLIAQDHIFLIFNFTEVDYLSSAGLRILLASTKKVKAHNGNIIIYGVQEHVMEVFKMTGFDHLLNIVNSRAEAIARFNVC